jgi:Rrf2 family nitric oxide-sensitive transcriptional repressor
MQLTRHTDYALRVLIFLALQPKGVRVTMADVEQHFAIPRNHLIKIVQRLGKLGYADTLRGKGGGLRLGRDAAAITIGEVVRDMESTLEMIDCAKPLCALHPGCRLKGILDEARQAFIDTLSRYTIADVIASPESFEAALGWHPVKEPLH